MWVPRIHEKSGVEPRERVRRPLCPHAMGTSGGSIYATFGHKHALHVVAFDRFYSLEIGVMLAPLKRPGSVRGRFARSSRRSNPPKSGDRMVAEAKTIPMQCNLCTWN